MAKTDTMRALLSAIEAQRWDEARSYLTDDFTFGGAVPEPIGPDAWLGMHKALGAAMPDLSFNATNIREDQDKVRLEVHLSGTQTRALTLPVPGVPAIEPTGKRVQLPYEPCVCTFQGDKLSYYEVQGVAGGGIPGILSQLGVTIPAHG